MARTACHVCLVTTVSGRCKNILSKASASSRHKTKHAGQKSRWADQARKLTGQSVPPNLFQACLLCFMPPMSTLVLLKWMFHNLICVEQSSFLRYLWYVHCIASCTYYGL